MEADKMNIDDKDLVIVAVTIITMMALYITQNVDIVTQALTGLFGIAVGRATK